MANQAKSDHGERYEIYLKGHLGSEWSDWFEGLSIIPDGQGNTILTVTIADQAAMHGILERIRDMGLTLLSINRIHR